MSLAQRNLKTVNTKIKQTVSQAYREVAAHPDSPEAVSFLRKVGAGLKALGQGIPLTKTTLNKEDFVDKAMPKIAKLEKVVAGGFAASKIPQPKDAKLKKGASTQIRNTMRPVSYLKGIKDALNGKTPDYKTAAARIERMADSLEVGVQLKAGNVTGARRKASAVVNDGYVPSSVQKLLTIH